MDRLYPPDWLDAEAAAHIISIPSSTFRDYVARGIFPPATKLEKHALWSRAEINATLEALRKPSKAKALSAALKGMGDGSQQKARDHAA